MRTQIVKTAAKLLRVNPVTPCISFTGKLKAEEIQQIPDKPSTLFSFLISDHWWKTPVLNAWLFKTPQVDEDEVVKECKIPAGLITLDKDVWGKFPLRPDVIRAGLVYENSWLQQVSAFSRTMSMVRGSKRKIFPQKGRGRARHGQIRAPQFRGGYKVHGNTLAKRTIDIPTNVYKDSIRHALSTKFAQDQVIVVDSLDIPSPDVLFATMCSIGIPRMASVYFLYGSDEPPVHLIAATDKENKKRLPSTRKGRKKQKQRLYPLKHKLLLPISAKNISLAPMMRSQYVVMDKAAVEILEEMYRDQPITNN